MTHEIANLYNRINIRHWEMLEDGVLTRERYWSSAMRPFEGLGIEGDAERTQALYETYLPRDTGSCRGGGMLLELSKTCHLSSASNGTQSVRDGRITSAGIARIY